MMSAEKNLKNEGQTLLVKQYLDSDNNRQNMTMLVRGSQSRQAMIKRISDYGIDTRGWQVDVEKGHTRFSGPLFNRPQGVKYHSKIEGVVPLSWAVVMRVKKRLNSWLILVQEGQVVLDYLLEGDEPQHFLKEDAQQAARDFFGSMFCLEFESLGNLPVQVKFDSVEVKGGCLKVTFNDM